METDNAVEQAVKPKEPEKPPIRLTFQQAYRHRAALDRKQCFLYQKGKQDKPYLGEPGMGYANSKEEAHRWTPARVFDYWGSTDTNYLIELVDQELAEKLAKQRCTIETALRASLIELLKLAPKNPIARSRVLADTGKALPDACQTYDEVKAWIEEHCNPMLNAEQRQRADRAARPAAAVDLGQHHQGGAPAEGIAFITDIRFTDRETGSCNYAARRTALQELNVTREDVAAAIASLRAEHGVVTLTNLETRLSALLQRDAWNRLEPDLEWDDNREVDYEEHEAADHGNSRTTIESATQFREALRDYLRATLPADQQRTMGV